MYSFGNHGRPYAAGDHRHVQHDVVPMHSIFNPEIAEYSAYEREPDKGQSQEQVAQYAKRKAPAADELLIS